MAIETTDAEGKGGITFGGNEIAKRPELAVKIALVGSSWAMLEAHAGQCLGVLMRADSRSAIALLQRFPTATAKEQTIAAVAKATLDSEQLGELKVLLRRFRELAKIRNDIAHGIWGTDPRQLEALIWAPSSIIADTTLSIVDDMIAGKSPDEILAARSEAFELYDAARFDAVLANLAELTKDLVEFATLRHVAALTARFGASTSGS
jgi:hypothetical protein